MSLSVEALWTVPVIELIGAYYKTRRDYVERKFARDTQRARRHCEEPERADRLPTVTGRGAGQCGFRRGHLTLP